MSNDEGQIQPSVEEVARLVDELTASPWPTTQDELSTWFAHHGIPTSGAEIVQEEHGSQSWRSADPGSLHSAAAWHIFEGQFVGVHWFLWHGLPDTVVPDLADQLRARLIEIAGEPVEESPPRDGDYRFTAYWETRGRCIDMYLHGGTVLGGQVHDTPVVQLHVDHIERAHRADQAAAKTQHQTRDQP